MSRRAQENAIALVLLAPFVAVLVMSFGYGPRAWRWRLRRSR